MIVSAVNGASELCIFEEWVECSGASSVPISDRPITRPRNFRSARRPTIEATRSDPSSRTQTSPPGRGVSGLAMIGRLERDHEGDQSPDGLLLVWLGLEARRASARIGETARGRGRRRGRRGMGDLSEGADGAEVLRADHRRLGQPLLDGRQDLDPLDRVDPQVGVELHAGLEDLGRVPRLLRDHLHQDRAERPRPPPRPVRGRRGRRSAAPAPRRRGIRRSVRACGWCRGAPGRSPGPRQPLLERPQDLNPLDRVDPRSASSCMAGSRTSAG